MWPGHGGLFHPSQPAHATQGRGLLHHPDLRERVPLVVTQALAAEPKGQPRTLLLLLVQLVEYLLVPRVELSILLITAAGPLGGRGGLGDGPAERLPKY